MGRAPCCDKTSVKKGPWSPEEDAKLKSYIEQHGTGGNWIALPQKIGLKRCGKSCRLRWLNYLRPNIRHGGFSEEEDRIICSLYVNIGSRWSIIAAQLPGRTDNDIKNYWNTRLKKKLFGKQRKERGGGHQSMSGRRGKRSLSSSSVLLNHHNISIINSPMVPNNNPINSSPNNQNLGQLSMPYWTPLITTHEATARATTSSSNILLNCSSSSNFNPLGFPDEPNFHSKRSLLLTPTRIEGDHHDSVTLDYGNYLHRHHYHDEGGLMNLPFLTDQQIIINDHFSSSGPLTNMMMTANNYNTTLEKLGQDTLYCTAGNSSNIINPPPVIATTMTTTTAADNNNNSFPLELEGLMSTNVVHPDHHLRERSLDEDGLDNLLPWNELIKYSCSDVVRTAGSCSDTSYGSDDDQSFNESSTWDEMGSLISLLIPPPAQVSADGFDESREVH